MTIFHGTKHNDAFDESLDTGSDTFELYKGGEDTVFAGSGDDFINMGASLDAGDRLDGGAGRDIVTLKGDYSAGVTFDDDTIQNIEVLRLKGGFDYKLTTADGNVAAGATLGINAALLGVANHLTFDGSAETDGHFLIYGGAGDDAITGGARVDVFHLENGGSDIAHGGGGNDIFFLGAALTAADTIDGGAGFDTLNLNGDYSGGVTFGASTITSIETIQLAAGHNYNLTTNDGNVAPGQALIVDGGALGPGDGLTFDGSAELDGSFGIFGGAGDDLLTGGAQADTFDLSLHPGGHDTVHGGGGDDLINNGTRSGSGEVFDGGAGNDTLVLSDFTTTLSSANFVSIERIILSGTDGADFKVDDSAVAAGATLTIDASPLVDSVAVVDVSSDTDSYFVLTGSSGDDDLRGGGLSTTFNLSWGGFDTAMGGNGNDTFNLANVPDPWASIDGGGGSDILNLSGAYASVTLQNFDTFQVYLTESVETVTFGGHFTYSDMAVRGDIADGSTLTLDASGAISIELNLAAATSTGYVVTGSDGNDSFTLSGSGANTVTGGLGADTFTAGAAADTFVYASAADSAADTKVHADTITDFDTTADHFDLPFAVTFLPGVIAVATADDFSDLGSVANSYFSPGENDAVVFHVNGGALAGHSILLVDFNGDAQYSGASDLAIDITGYTGTMTGANFI